MLLPDYLETKTTPKLAKVIHAIADAAKEIQHQIRIASGAKAGSENTFGEEQLKLDVVADEIFFEKLKETEVVAVAASEENAKENVLHPKGEFTVVFDPLDGSSLVDVNLAVGSIFGIWKGKEIVGRKGKELVAAGYVVYGPRTTLIFTFGEKPTKFTLQPDERWLQIREKMKVGEGKMFAPGNLRAIGGNENYKKLVDFWCEKKYTLRYSGGMVPDIHQILIKEKGVFSYPGSKENLPKLRLVFECIPLAFIMEKANGSSSDGERSILEKEIQSLDERSVVCLGSKDEVKRFEEFLKA